MHEKDEFNPGIYRRYLAAVAGLKRPEAFNTSNRHEIKVFRS